MTLPSALNRVDALGNGSATVFSFAPVVLFEASDLQVTLRDPSGNEGPVSAGTGSTNYSLGLSVFPNTGSINYPAVGGTPLPAGWTIVMKRIVPEVQDTRLENQGAYLPRVLENALDYLTAITQQLQEQVSRSIAVPNTDQPLAPLAAAVARANRILGFDGTGVPVLLTPASAVVASIVGPVTPQMFGAVGNGVADDTAAIQAAANAAASTGHELWLYGTYLITAAITVTGALSVVGAGKTSTNIKLGTANQVGFLVTGTAPTIFRNFAILGNGFTGTTGIKVAPIAGENSESIFRDLQLLGFALGIDTEAASTIAVDNVDVLNYTLVGLLVRNTHNVDSGDSAVSNCFFLAAGGSTGAGIQQQSSGGLKITNSKFLAAAYGYILELDNGNTGDLMISNSSFEGQSVCGITLTQSTGAATFANVAITGCQFNLTPEAIGLTNITPGWIKNVAVSGNVFSINAGGTAIQFDGASGFVIGDNTIWALGGGVTFASITAQSANGHISHNGNLGAATYVTNASPSTVVEPMIQRGTQAATTAGAYGSLFGSAPVAILFRQPYLVAPTVTVTAAGGTGAISGLATGISTTGFNLVGLGTTNATALTFNWTAAGN